MRISQSSNLSNIIICGNGSVIVSDSVRREGYFFAIHAITDTVIEEIEFEDRIEGSMDGMTIKAGSTIHLFRITSFKAQSGNCILYKA